MAEFDLCLLPEINHFRSRVWNVFFAKHCIYTGSSVHLLIQFPGEDGKQENTVSH